MNSFQRFIPITKTDPSKQMVYGWASTNDLDSQGEIVSVEALKQAIPNYMQFPAIREMHQPKAIGVTKQTRIDSGRGLFIGAKIVDRGAWEKVQEGVLRGFSIGGKVKQMDDNIITNIDLHEISLVDRPANKKAVITLFKRNDKPEKSSFQQQHLEMLKGKKTMLVSEQSIKKVNSCLKEVSQMTEELKKAKPKKVKEEVKEVKEEVKEEVKAPEAPVAPKTPEVVVDEAKQVAEQPSDLTKRLDKLEKRMVEKKVKKEAKLSKVKVLTKDLIKVASVLEGLLERVEKLEAQPALPKTKASFLISKADEGEDPEDGKDKVRLEKIAKRLNELDKIRSSDLAKFQQDFQQEAWELLDERKRLTK